MEEEQADILDNAQVRRAVEAVWPEIVAWDQRLHQPWQPDPGSPLSLDDQEGPEDMWLSTSRGSALLLARRTS